jgi:hypothetical protein
MESGEWGMESEELGIGVGLIVSVAPITGFIFLSFAASIKLCTPYKLSISHIETVLTPNEAALSKSFSGL